MIQLYKNKKEYSSVSPFLSFCVLVYRYTQRISLCCSKIKILLFFHTSLQIKLHLIFFLMDKLNKLFENLFSKHSSLNVDTPKECYLLQLPSELLQIITEYLPIRDLCAFARTCQTLNTLINTDAFWAHRIRAQFPSSITDLWTYDVFQKPVIIPTIDEQCSNGFINRRDESNFDRTAADSATHFNDQAVEKRQEKMFVSKEDFQDAVQYFQYEKPRYYRNVPFMKLVYFYLIDRKRTAVVDMDVVHRNDHFLVERQDNESLKGRIIALQSVCWLEITGFFPQKLMPGKYEVIWKMKSPDGDVRVYDQTEFIVVPTHGRLLNYRVSENDFRSYATEHGNRWFSVNMGETILYRPSIVHVAVRNWTNGYWKSGIAWDCIELKIVS